MIKNHTPEDHTFIADLAESAFGRFGPYRSIFEGMMNGARVPGVLGEVEIFVHSNEAGRQTGFISVEWRNGTANIHGVAVSEEFRRQGIAARLLDHVIESASLKRITSFECITAETENLQALSFFENKEFIVHGFAGSYPRGQRAVRLKRDHSF